MVPDATKRLEAGVTELNALAVLVF
jgi:hypothetical protein